MCNRNAPIHIFIKNTSIDFIPQFKTLHKINNILYCCAIENLLPFIIKKNGFVWRKRKVFDLFNRQALNNQVFVK